MRRSFRARGIVERIKRLVAFQAAKKVQLQLRKCAVSGRGTQPGVRADDWARIGERIYEGRRG